MRRCRQQQMLFVAVLAIVLRSSKRESGIGSSSPPRGSYALSIGWGSVSWLTRPAHRPFNPPSVGEVDLKFEQL